MRSERAFVRVPGKASRFNFVFFSFFCSSRA